MAIEAELLAIPPRKISHRQGPYFDPWYAFSDFGCGLGGSALLLALGLGLKFAPLAFAVIVYFGVSTLFLILATVQNIQEIRQNKFLVQYGTPIEGLITKVQKAWSTTPRVLYYSFTAGTGEVIEGGWRNGTGRFYELQEKDTLTILYSLQSPSLNIPYESAIFKAEL